MIAQELANEWREKAHELRKVGAEAQASTFEYCADELEHTWWTWCTEPLTVSEAAVESGYTEDHLRQLVRDKKLPDSRPPGSQGQIALRRCDLPRKARWERSGTPVEEMTEALLASRR
ncbi:hypothetical protein ACFL3S_05550 [Gemmatimonadota bacterium]